jgi:hypothetical protein
MLRVLLVGVMLSSPATLASAQTPKRWGALGTFGSEAVRVEADQARAVRLPNGQVQVWVRGTYPRNQSLEDRPLLKYRSWTKLYVADCERRTLGVAEEVYHDIDGDVVHSRLNDRARSGFWLNVVPETIGEAILDAACKSLRAHELQRQKENARDALLAEREKARAALQAEREELKRLVLEGDSNPGFAPVEASVLTRRFCTRDPEANTQVYADSVILYFSSVAVARRAGYLPDAPRRCASAKPRAAPTPSELTGPGRTVTALSVVDTRDGMARALLRLRIHLTVGCLTIAATDRRAMVGGGFAAAL